MVSRRATYSGFARFTGGASRQQKADVDTTALEVLLSASSSRHESREGRPSPWENTHARRGSVGRAESGLPLYPILHDMTHPVLSLYPFLHAIDAKGGSVVDQVGLLASIERDDDKGLDLETPTALLTVCLAANTTLRTLEVKCDPQADWGVDLELALAGRSGGIRRSSPSRWPLRAGASATRIASRLRGPSLSVPPRDR